MNKYLFTIGEISKMKGITAKALRFYDDIGLLKPYSVDQSNQYRYYHPSQLLHIDIIKAARNLEISPNDLIPLFQKQDSTGLITLLQSQREKALEKLQKLQNVITGIDYIRENMLAAQNSASQDAVYTRKIPQRHIIAKPWIEHTDPQEYLDDFSTLDMLVDHLQGIATYENGVLFKICENSTLPDQIFTSVAKPVASEHCISIPEGTYLCVNFTEESAIDKQALINDYLASRELTPLGIVQTELLTNLFHTEHTQWELQIRI
ncbi:MAG: MerR family DNA-binding transcriptional regulator [Thermoclostridium sp.]|nr:MerR family DNA-binding transcriptional regulator [Thermoclostridium sp.]